MESYGAPSYAARKNGCVAVELEDVNTDAVLTELINTIQECTRCFCRRVGGKMKLLKEIRDSFIEQPVWTVYSLALSPVFFTLLALTSATVGLINLSWQDACDFWRDNT